MRIALCLHGLVGSESSKYGGKNNINIQIPYKFLRKNLLNSNKNKFDIFLHSQSYEEKKRLLRLYKPKLYKIEKQKNFDFLDDFGGGLGLHNPSKIDHNAFQKAFDFRSVFGLPLESNLDAFWLQNGVQKRRFSTAEQHGPAQLCKINVFFWFL